MDNEELAKILMENRKMRQALEFINNWDLPRVEHRGESISYESARGSNGARDYMRKVARDAIGI